MSETITIPAHIEDGSLRLDAPLPKNIEWIEVRARVAPVSASSGRSVAAYIESLPPGERTGEDIDGQIAEERASWPDEALP